MEAIKQLGGFVEEREKTSVPKWIRDSFPEDFFTEVVEVDLRDTDVTDAGLKHLKGLSNLAWLNLDRTRITDAGLEHLEGLTNLVFLSLQSPEITDRPASNISKG